MFPWCLPFPGQTSGVDKCCQAPLAEAIVPLLLYNTITALLLLRPALHTLTYYRASHRTQLEGWGFFFLILLAGRPLHQMSHAWRKTTPVFWRWHTLACTGSHTLSPLLSWAHHWPHTCSEHGALWDNSLKSPTLNRDVIISHKGQEYCSVATFSWTSNCLSHTGISFVLPPHRKAQRFWKETGTTV